jgi:formate hydrogenlyase subunit 3/multisubunit Na+/H+ antiporter MnhD subunit
LLAIVLKTYGILSEGWTLSPQYRHFSLAGAALAGAGVLTVGMYPIFRIFGPVLSPTSDWREPVFWAGAAIAIVASLSALSEADYRRALAHGALGQFGLLTAVYSVGSPAATQGAIVGSIVVAFAFTGLFLSVGAAEEATSQVVLSKVGGLAQRLPLTAVLFFVSSILIVGLPPLGGAIAGRLIGAAADSAPRLSVLWEVTTGLTVLYLARLFVSLFLGELRGPVQTEKSWPSLVFGGGLIGATALLVAMSPDLLALLAPLANLRSG